MAQVRFDEHKCTGCGLCISVCPHRLFRATGGIVVCDQDNCMRCGHCRAVCPVAAIAIPGLETTLGLKTVVEADGVAQGGLPGCAELVRLMQRRRSCRVYDDRPVDLALLEDLAKIGTTAPSATNSQGWGFILFSRRHEVLALGEQVGLYYRRLNRLASRPWLRKLLKLLGRPALYNYHCRYGESVSTALHQWDEEGIDRLFHGATAAILVTGHRSASCPAEDALLATQNILLAAETMGLGSCLIGFVVEAVKRSRELRRWLRLPPDEDLYSVIALGYPHPTLTWNRFAGRMPVKLRHGGGGRVVGG